MAINDYGGVTDTANTKAHAQRLFARINYHEDSYLGFWGGLQSG